MNLIRQCTDRCWEVLEQISDPEIPLVVRCNRAGIYCA